MAHGWKELRVRASLAFTAFLLLPATVRADESTVTFGRSGRTSCGQFIAAMVKHKVMQQDDGAPHPSGAALMSDRALMMEYVDGLLTGINLSRDPAHQIRSDDAALELWLQNWCGKHPSDSLVKAVVALSVETPRSPLP